MSQTCEDVQNRLPDDSTPSVQLTTSVVDVVVAYVVSVSLRVTSNEGKVDVDTVPFLETVLTTTVTTSELSIGVVELQLVV